MEIPKKYFGQDILLCLRIIEVCSFILANLIIASIFYLLITNYDNFCLLVSFMAFVLSILILKNNWVFLLFTPRKNEDSSSQNEKKSDEGQIKVSLKNIFVVLFKQIFFNISYELFPLLVIWICWFGLCYIIINFGFFNFLLSYYSITSFQFKQSFFQVIPIIGILLGVYQFYLSRQEQKILSKINFYSNRIKQVIWKETTFEKYFSSVHGVTFEKWLIDITDPKMAYFTFFKEVRKDPDAYEGFLKMFFPIRKDRRARQPIMNLQLSYKDSNQKFEAIESRAKIDGHENALKESYVDFFARNEKVTAIMEEIRQEINDYEFFILILSNINIVQEVIPDFIGQDFLKNIGDSMRSDSDIHKFFEKCETASEYRQALEVVITQKIISKMGE